MRKVIQILETDRNDMKALCDDGSLWALGTSINEWHRLPDIPQDAVDSTQSYEDAVSLASQVGGPVLSDPDSVFKKCTGCKSPIKSPNVRTGKHECLYCEENTGKTKPPVIAEPDQAFKKCVTCGTALKYPNFRKGKDQCVGCLCD